MAYLGIWHTTHHSPPGHPGSQSAGTARQTTGSGAMPVLKSSIFPLMQMGLKLISLSRAGTENPFIHCGCCAPRAPPQAGHINFFMCSRLCQKVPTNLTLGTVWKACVY